MKPVLPGIESGARRKEVEALAEDGGRLSVSAQLLTRTHAPSSCLAALAVAAAVAAKSHINNKILILISYADSCQE